MTDQFLLFALGMLTYLITLLALGA